MSVPQSAPQPSSPTPGEGLPILEVINLKTHFFTEDGVLPAVDGVNFSIPRGRTLALVGESGCGKSVTSYSILRLIQRPGRIVEGQILLHSTRSGTIDIAQLDDDDERIYHIRGGLVSMIFQEPMTALSPVHTVGDQIAEAISCIRMFPRRRPVIARSPCSARWESRHPSEGSTSTRMKCRVVCGSALS